MSLAALIGVVQSAGAGALVPRQPYILALAAHADGSGPLQPLANYTTNPAGAAVVNVIGPIRQLLQAESPAERRYLVIAPQNGTGAGRPVQAQTP